ncbi:collagen-like domain-containing protein [Kribbella jiaozuonensis]|uniref:Uncharacterized protein n=1 Tax=Kribbella jiaozuonensis TaxID=2575441 RepID=A0A4U3LJ18_9ACTN|nr:hypothetical protein [Kribbella jiaozuonensis]TKK75601.1 hypothetical protein FDA38_35020 [Kribbella jiaozuonensis]
MSEPSSEPRQGRISRWRARSRGTKTMKAGYALAARDVKNWDKDVLARIGSSRMTPAHLARLAQVGVNAQIRPEQHAATSQSMSQRATNRMQWSQRQQSPTRNPFRQAARRISRWQDVRHGTKMVKAGMVLAAKEAKNADPNVRLAMGNDPTITKSQISNMVQGQMESAFKPELYAPRQEPQQGAGQQQVQGQGQQVEGQQPVQGQQVPQQVPGGQRVMQQLTAAAGGQAAGETEQALVQALAEFQRLQGEIKQLIETRMAQIQQENANLSALLNQVSQPGQQVGQQPQLDPNLHNVGQHPVVRTEETAQQQPEGPQQTEGEEVAEGPQGGDGEQTAEGQPVVVENAVEGGSQQVVVQSGQDGQQVEATGEQVPRAEGWTRVAEEPENHAEQPVEGAAQGQTEASGGNLAAKAEASRAAQAAGDVAPPRPSSPQQAAETAQSGRQDQTQRTGQLATKSSKDTGRGN